MAKREKNQWANQLVDIIKAVRLLSRPQGADNDELAEELGSGERTIYRLRKTLEELNIPLEEVEGNLLPRKRFRITKGATLLLPKVDTVGLETPELLALYVLRGVAGIYQGSAIIDDIDSAFRKIGSALSPETRLRLERYSRLFIVAPKCSKNYAASANLIEELSYAMIDRKACAITYNSFGNDQTKSYEINPLHFFEHDGGLYLLAVVPRYGDMITLAVERMQQVDMTDKGFEYPRDFDPEDFLSSAFSLYFDDPVQVKIRFDPSQARYIQERTWAREQQFDTAEDGYVTLTMKTSGWYDIKRWVMSYGSKAELLEPKEMREEIIRELDSSLGCYRSS